MGNKKEQFFEGGLAGCERYKCGCSCCDDNQVEEWVNEFFLFHERMKENLISHGIKINFKGDRVEFKKCSSGKECKFLKYSLNKDADPRPIDCKIYPYAVDWKSIDFDKKIVKVLYWDKGCPLVKNNAIPDSFNETVANIIKRDFAVLFYGANFKVSFVKKIL
jgi:hypothetical protein